MYSIKQSFVSPPMLGWSSFLNTPPNQVLDFIILPMYRFWFYNSVRALALQRRLDRYRLASTGD